MSNPADEPIIPQSFYSVDLHLQPEAGKIWATRRVVPLGFPRGASISRRVLGEDDLRQLGRFFLVDEFFIPPASGCFFGAPEPPITRAIMYVLPDGSADLHFRCTPLTDWLTGVMPPERVAFIIETTRRIIDAGGNIIIAGPSGSGKTRFGVAYVLPLLAGHFAYIETLPEIVGWLRQRYSSPPALYYSVVSPGLHGSMNADLHQLVVYLRSCGVPYVFFQEAHTAGSGYVTPEMLAQLMSSGVPFCITTHPCQHSAIDTAKWYQNVYGLTTGLSFLYMVGPNGVTITVTTRDTIGVILRATPTEIQTDAFVCLPESLRMLLSANA